MLSTLNLRAVRKSLGWTQQRAAERLGVSQALVSMVENGERSLTPEMLDRLGAYYDVDPRNLPLREEAAMTDSALAQELANLGYPGFAHRRKGKASWNPAELLVMALSTEALDRRVAEALPWLVMRFAEMEWNWVVNRAKVLDLQNRLGFAVTLARELAETQNLGSPQRLQQLENQVERSRLVRQGTYCNERMTQAERRWLQTNASPQAQHWNLLSDLRPEDLTHVR